MHLIIIIIAFLLIYDANTGTKSGVHEEKETLAGDGLKQPKGGPCLKVPGYQVPDTP